MKLEFKDEMLIPNGDVYYSIYELENWLRRISLSVYMMEYGDLWLENVPKRVYERYMQRSTKTNEIYYFDADSEDNLIWSLTHSELSELLLNPKVWDRVHMVIGFTNERFKQKLFELREIRNILAHNRALSERTAVIVQGIIESMHLAVDKFKQNYLYTGNFEILHSGNDKIGDYFVDKMDEHDPSNFQSFISVDKDLFSIACLPVEREGKYPSAYKLLNCYKDVLDSILAIQVNKSGDEYLITFPKKVSLDNIKRIVDRFTRNDPVWTNRRFEDQHPKYICNPKIWFYENNKPIEE
ncbi:hypothetical protein ACFPVX_10480 [Cohnella faecalis]|uniref:hypothetical protein n=1 Tax=Cohnella faecalis TaxID=2315694 RepID=UPI0011C2189D|nr:hypothetical protein [Cohnella faecalis]